MDQRLHRRIPATIEVRLTNLERPGATSTGTLCNVSKSGAAVIIPDRFEAGDLVQVDTHDAVLFGHVIHVDEVAEGFRTGIDIEQVLLGTSDLSNLIEALSEGGVAEQKPVES